MTERAIQQVYSIKEVADILDVSPQTVRELLRVGGLRPFRVGRLYRISHKAIQELVDSSGDLS